MKLFKSVFDKVHLVFMLFAAVNLLLGFALTRNIGQAWETAGVVHLVSGILLVVSVVFLPMFLKDGKKLYKALAARALPVKRDFEQKRYLVISAKSAVLLMALGFVMLFLTAVAIKTNIAPSLMSFHTRFLYIMIALALIHPILMKASRVKRRKPVSAK